MNNELAKTISTCAIWLSVACILTFGIFKMNVNGYPVVFLIVFCLPAMIVGCALKATTTIWKSQSQDQECARSPSGTTKAVLDS